MMNGLKTGIISYIPDVRIKCGQASLLRYELHRLLTSKDDSLWSGGLRARIHHPKHSNSPLFPAKLVDIAACEKLEKHVARASVYTAKRWIFPLS